MTSSFAVLASLQLQVPSPPNSNRASVDTLSATQALRHVGIQSQSQVFDFGQSRKAQMEMTSRLHPRGVLGRPMKEVPCSFAYLIDPGIA